MRSEERTKAQHAYMSGVCLLATCVLIISNGKGRTADSTVMNLTNALGQAL